MKLAWTSEFPGVEGYYWISWTYGPNRKKRHQYIQYIKADGYYNDPTDWDDEHRSHISKLGVDTMFYGPIKEPKPPVEKENG